MSMRTWLLVSVVCATLAADEKEPSPRTIIEKAINVAGGKQKLSYQAFWYRERGTLLSDGEKVPLTAEFWYLNDRTLKYSLEIRDKDRVVRIVRVLNGDQAWETVDGKMQEKGFPAAEYQELGQLYGFLRLYPLLEGNQLALKLLGEKKIADSTVYRIGVTKGSFNVEIYFNKKTGALAGYGAEDPGPAGKDVWAETLFLEMADFNGFNVPKRLRMTIDGKNHIERDRLEWKPIEKFPEGTFAKP